MGEAAIIESLVETFGYSTVEMAKEFTRLRDHQKTLQDTVRKRGLLINDLETDKKELRRVARTLGCPDDHKPSRWLAARVKRLEIELSEVYKHMEAIF